MTNGLKKEDSAALKGLAVLLLIFHHCYRLADRIERYQVDLCGLTTEQLVAIAECCKICVAIFAFVSGYGLMYGYSAKMKNKEKYAVSEWISGHLLSTMSGFWFTAAVSYLIYFGLGLKTLTLIKPAIKTPTVPAIHNLIFLLIQTSPFFFNVLLGLFFT